MNYIRTATPVDVLDTLKRFRDDALNAQILKSAWPVIERLIDREDEMRSVWNDIARYGLSRQQCHSLIEQIVFAGVHGRNEAVLQLKADYSQLANLNKDIVLIAKQLAAKLDAREHILNRNSFTLDNTVHIVELIDDAAAGNSRYRSCVREPLRCLGNHELKYWPSLQDILRTIAGEALEIGFMDESDRALVYGRGELVPDYLRELFSRIELVRTCYWRLPVGFRLTDASLATLATVSLDLNEPVSNAAVKMHRTRLSKAGFSGAWPVRKKKNISRKPRRDDRQVRTEPGA